MKKQNKPRYIVHDNTVYEAHEKPLVTVYRKREVPVGPPIPNWKGSRIPWDLWEAILALMLESQKQNESEGLVFLFYDTDTNAWSPWFPPQTTCGMSVKTDPSHPEYAKQRKKYPDLQMGSVHHHCTSTAFASGTDKNDEEDRDGIHITLGHMDKDKLSIHCRICAEGFCHEIDPESVIEPKPEFGKLPEKYLRKIHGEAIRDPQWGARLRKSASKIVRKNTRTPDRFPNPSLFQQPAGGIRTDIAEMNERIPGLAEKRPRNNISYGELRKILAELHKKQGTEKHPEKCQTLRLLRKTRNLLLDPNSGAFAKAAVTAFSRGGKEPLEEDGLIDWLDQMEEDYE